MHAPSTPPPARLQRLAGALLLMCEGQYFLIGNTKEPCDWKAVGFERPPEGDAVTLRVRRLQPLGNDPALDTTPLTIEPDGRSPEHIAAMLADRLLIVRNASFSERLWRIVTGASDESPVAAADGEDVTWLLAMPERVWEIVREAALKCM